MSCLTSVAPHSPPLVLALRLVQHWPGLDVCKRGAVERSRAVWLKGAGCRVGRGGGTAGGHAGRRQRSGWQAGTAVELQPSWSCSSFPIHPEGTRSPVMTFSMDEVPLHRIQRWKQKGVPQPVAKCVCKYRPQLAQQHCAAQRSMAGTCCAAATLAGVCSKQAHPGWPRWCWVAGSQTASLAEQQPVQ